MPFLFGGDLLLGAGRGVGDERTKIRRVGSSDSLDQRLSLATTTTVATTTATAAASATTVATATAASAAATTRLRRRPLNPIRITAVNASLLVIGGSENHTAYSPRHPRLFKGVIAAALRALATEEQNYRKYRKADNDEQYQHGH
jgi:hypothetical protein